MIDDRNSSVFGFLKNPSMVDFPGRMAATFFVSGCNLRCGFCHNANLMGRSKPGLEWSRLRMACDGFRADWVSACVISGGEPTLAPDLPELIEFFKSFGFAVKLDTNGTMPEALQDVLPMVDYVAMDVKCALDDYAELTGLQDPEPIRASIDLILNHARDYEFRTTLITDYHDARAVDAIGQTIAGAKRVVVQPFIPRDDLPSTRFSTVPRTTPSVLREAAMALEPYAHEVVVRGAGKDLPTR